MLKPFLPSSITFKRGTNKKIIPFTRGIKDQKIANIFQLFIPNIKKNKAERTMTITHPQQ